MSTNPPEVDEADAAEESPPSPLDEYATRIADAAGGSAEVEHDTIKIRVSTDGWRAAVEAGRAEGLTLFEFLSAIDWANEVAVGDEPEEPLDERYELLCALTDVVDRKTVIFSTDLAKDAARIDSVEPVFPGAQWHEREATEMFGIHFEDLSDHAKLYLPDDFQGYPLRKSYPLLSREVKPWPGDVDVEDMPEKPADGPSTENPGA